jgi:hypothetical protein
MLPLVRFGLSRVSAVAIRRVAPLALPFGALATHSLLQQPVAVCEKVVVESIEINGEKLDTKEITMTTTKGTTVVIATFSRRIWASIFDALYGIMKMFGGAVIGGVTGFGMAASRPRDFQDLSSGMRRANDFRLYTIIGLGLGSLAGTAYAYYKLTHDFVCDDSATGGTLAGQTEGMKKMCCQAIHKDGTPFNSLGALYMKSMIQSFVSGVTGGTLPYMYMLYISEFRQMPSDVAVGYFVIELDEE